MKKLIYRLLDIEPAQGTRVFIMLGMGFFMGVFLATLNVSASALFLQNFDEQTDLPLAVLLSGAAGIVLTTIYNFLQSRIPYRFLAFLTILFMAAILGSVQYALSYFPDIKEVYRAVFILMLPVSYLSLLVFWGTFGRIFTLRESKKIIGSIDTGQLIASMLALFSIPVLQEVMSTSDLLKISLAASVGVLLMVLLILFKGFYSISGQKIAKRVSFPKMFRSRYVTLMALFIIVSMISVSFVDFSFLNATAQQFLDPKALANFISLFEATVVIFSFLFQTFVTDRIISLYGLRVSLIINPLLILGFTGIATAMGFLFGFEKAGNPTFIFFFIIIAMSKLFIASLKDALDGPSFKLYFLPIDTDVRFDVQTKLEGIIMAFAGLMAGSLLYLFNNLGLSLIYVTIFTLPLLFMWYLITNRMHGGYKDTLQNTLKRNKTKKQVAVRQEFAVNQVLVNEVNNTKNTENVIYSLKLMEKLEPALFESTVVGLLKSPNEKIAEFAREKVIKLNLQFEKGSDIHSLAIDALGNIEDRDVLDVSELQLEKLGKSVKPVDRITAARLLRSKIGSKNIFLLLELLRDMNEEVRHEAIVTARKVKRPETWTILIEMTDSVQFGHSACSALIEAGESALHTLEMAFSKSGQRDSVMLKIIMIVGRIGGDNALKFLWGKIDYPDKRISSEVLIWLRYFNYEASSIRERQTLFELLDEDISKAIWNISALQELPDVEEYKFLREALVEELEYNNDHIFMLLSLLYDKESIQLVRENIESATSEGITFALELMDIFIDKDLRPKLFPLFDDIDPKDKLEQLQIYFPRETYQPRDVLNFILNRNFDQANRWTKATALHALAFIDNFKVTKAMVAQLFNPDYMLRETASWVIYHKDRVMFEKVGKRLPPDDRKLLEESIARNQLIEGLDDGAFLRVEMTMFMKNLSLLKRIHGLQLCELADRMHIVQLSPGQSQDLSARFEYRPIMIVAEGEVVIDFEDGNQLTLTKGDVFGDVFVLDDLARATKLNGITQAVVFTISATDFYDIMGDNIKLVQEMIGVVTESVSTKKERSI